MNNRNIILLVVFNMILISAIAQNELMIDSERIVLTELEEGKSIDNKNYHLTMDGDSLLVLNSEKLKLEKVLDFYVIHDSLRHYLIDLQEVLVDFDTRFQLTDYIVSNNEFYLIYSNFCYVIKVSDSYTFEAIRRIEFLYPFDGVQIDKGKIYFTRSKRYNSLKKDENNLQVGVLNEHKVELISKFETQNYYLLHFETRNHFIVNNGIVYYAPPGKPQIEEYHINVDSSSVNFVNETWNTPTMEEVLNFNKLSDRNPNAMFSAVIDCIDLTSYNLRLDKIDSSHFGITYYLGDTSDVNGYQMDIYTYSNSIDSMTQVKSFSINASRKESIDELGQLHFGFRNTDRYNFCYKDGKRFQLSVEPKADWSDNNAERIKEERNQSMLNNQFELCLYIGTLDLD